MTALETPFNPGQARGQAPQVGRQGIQLTPNAPGLVPLPPTSQKGSQLRQMIDAIGLAGQVGRTAGSIADKEVRRREFKQRDFDRLYESAAVVQARVAITEVRADIDSGKIEVPEGANVGEFAAELAQARLPDEAPDAYKNRYQSILVPEVANHIATRQAEAIEKARRENVKLVGEAAYSIAGSPEEMMDLVEQAKRLDPNLSDTEARAAVLLPALQVAIEQGDRTSFDTIAKTLGPAFATTIARARIQVDDQSLRNEMQDKSERMVEATRITDAAIESPHLTDEMVRDSIDKMNLDSTQKSALYRRVNNSRSEQIAVDRSKRKQLLDTIHDSVTTPEQLRSRLDSFAEQLGLTDREIEHEILVYAQAEVALAASRGELDKIDSLAPTLGEGAEATLFLETARAEAINVKRDRRFKAVLNGMQARGDDGSPVIDPATVRQLVAEDAKRAIDSPDSPDVFSAAQRDDLMRRAGTVEKRDLSIERVSKVLGGDGRAVITRGDDEAIDLALGAAEEGGTGMIDANNNITDPARLGASVAALNRVTPYARDVIMTTLMKGHPDQQVQAIQAISVIAQGRPGLLSELVGDDPKAGWVVSEIRVMTERGTIENQPGVARERIGALISDLSETTISQPEVDALLKTDNINLGSQLDLVLESAADLMPWHNPTMLPLDQADLVDANDEATQYLSNQFRQQYYYQRKNGVNKRDATEFARRTSQELLIRNFDFVRFNGELHVQRVDNGVNRLREDFRWSDGYDTQIEAFADRNGIDTSEVFTVRPTTGMVVGNKGEPIEGWLLIDHNLDPITDDRGRVLLWEPPDTSRDKAMQTRKLLETKHAEFEKTRKEKANRPAHDSQIYKPSRQHIGGQF